MTGSALMHAADLGVRLPAAVLRWWIAPWPALPATRDEALQTAVAAGGALLLAYAAWAHLAHRATASQVRGLALAGVGFLLSAYASASLHGHPVLGPAVSLAGAAVVLRATLALVRERHETQGHDPRRGPPPRA